MQWQTLSVPSAPRAEAFGNRSVHPGLGAESHPGLATFPRCCALLSLGDTRAGRPPAHLETLREKLSSNSPTPLQLLVSFEHSFGCAHSYYHALLNAVVPLFELLKLLAHRVHRGAGRRVARVYVHSFGGAVTSLFHGLFPELDLRSVAWVPQCCSVEHGSRFCSDAAQVPGFATRLLPVRLDTRILDCGAPCFRHGTTRSRLRALLTELRDRSHRLYGFRVARPRRVLLIDRQGGTPHALSGFKTATTTGAARRHVLNQDLLAQALAGVVASMRNPGVQGFTFDVVAFEELRLPEQLALLHDTGVLVGLHGAGMANCVWMPDRAAVFELVPQDYPHFLFEWLCSEVLQLLYRVSDLVEVVQHGVCSNNITFCGTVSVTDVNNVATGFANFLRQFLDLLNQHPTSWRSKSFKQAAVRD